MGQVLGLAGRRGRFRLIVAARACARLRHGRGPLVFVQQLEGALAQLFLRKAERLQSEEEVRQLVAKIIFGIGWADAETVAAAFAAAWMPMESSLVDLLRENDFHLRARVSRKLAPELRQSKRALLQH